MKPVILELAINGETRPERNPSVPRRPRQIASEAISLMNGGASIIHNHVEDYRLGVDAAAARYGEGWAPVLARHPDAILCPTAAGTADDAERAGHFEPLAIMGARMAPLDPGNMNMPLAGGGGVGGGEVPMFNYVNTFDHIGRVLDAMAHAGLAASLGIYEPGFLRAALAFHRAGKLPPGSFVKLYFFGGRNYFDDQPCLGFGLNPSSSALDSYLQILGDSSLPWAVAVVGGDVFASGMARLAIERGGGVRLGLEDFSGDRVPTNLTLLDEVVGLCKEAGRAPATARETAAMLGLA